MFLKIRYVDTCSNQKSVLFHSVVVHFLETTKPCHHYLLSESWGQLFLKDLLFVFFQLDTSLLLLYTNLKKEAYCITTYTTSLSPAICLHR